MAGEYEAQTILDTVPPRGGGRWPIQYHLPTVEHFDVTEKGVAGTGGGDHPFKIHITTTEGGAYKYTLTKGSVVDGTNGAALAIGDPEAERDPSAGFITLKATLDTDLTILSWAIGIEDAAAAAEEVEIDAGPPVVQTVARLVIGKLTMGEGTPPVPTAWQMWFTSARLTHGLMNGLAVRVFDSAPTHPSKV